MNPPLVSIIIPTYNGAKFLREAIESVLSQTFKNWELLVIDDASTDGTAALVETYLTDARVRYIRNETNLGISKTRNRGLSLAGSKADANSKYIAMLDSDDVWLDHNKLAEQVRMLESDPHLGIVGTWMVQIDEKSQEIRRIKFETSDYGIRKNLLYYSSIAQSSVAFRKEAALAVGGYDETMHTMEDHDLWLKIGTRYAFATLPTYSLGYRIHASGITKKRAFRVAMDELTVVFRHRENYPGFLIGLVKGILRPLYYTLKMLFGKI